MLRLTCVPVSPPTPAELVLFSCMNSYLYLQLLTSYVSKPYFFATSSPAHPNRPTLKDAIWVSPRPSPSCWAHCLMPHTAVPFSGKLPCTKRELSHPPQAYSEQTSAND